MMDREEFHKTASEVEDRMGVCGLADRDFYEEFAFRITEIYITRLLRVARAAKALWEEMNRDLDIESFPVGHNEGELEDALAEVEHLL